MEIVIGFLAAAVGIVAGVKIAALPDVNAFLWMWAAPVRLITLGGYRALAGHRSHWYQSNNRLAAWLAEVIRSHRKQPEKTR